MLEFLGFCGILGFWVFEACNKPLTVLGFGGLMLNWFFPFGSMLVGETCVNPLAVRGLEGMGGGEDGFRTNGGET